MTSHGDALVEALLDASRSLLGIVIRSVQAAPVGVTIPQHRVLVLLEEGPLGVGAIAAELGVNPSNASRLCDRLQGMGLIRRRRSDQDRRTVLVDLTAGGRDNIAAVSAHRRAEISQLVAHLEGQGSPALVRALNEISDAAAELERTVTGRGRARSTSS